jgi:hypothetical protein
MGDKWDEIEAAAMAEITNQQERAAAVPDEKVYRIYRETYKAINELARAIEISDPFPESEFGQWTLQVIREDLLTLSETEALQKYKAMAREILGRRLLNFGDRDELLVRLRLPMSSEISEMRQWAVYFLSGTVDTSAEPAVGGFVGFCLKKICEMPEEQRGLFLSVNRGDQSFYDLRDSWFHEYGKPLKRPGDLLSKAKKLYRELNPELKN